MTPDDMGEFRKSLAALAVATAAEKLDAPTVEVYWQFLADLPVEGFRKAVGAAGRTLKWFPKPSELRGMAIEPIGVRAALAWEAVRQAMDRHDYTASVDFGPLVNSIVRNLGDWVALCNASVPDLVWRRKDFERLYEEFAAKAIDAERGAPLRGSFGGAPVRIAIGGVLPPAQIEAQPTNGSGKLRTLIHELAEEKSR